MDPVPRMVSPVCLIKNEEGKTLQVNPEAERILKNISQPLVVISIAGPYRSGKSYLMNKLAGACGGGFCVGDTVEAKTKGIWMWCIPHPEKRDHTLVLLDTEGLGDVMKIEKQSELSILTLSVLISSTMIYNSKGVIGQEDLEKLYAVSEYREYLMDRESKNTQEDGEGVEPEVIPLFIWVLRDFSLQLEINGRPFTEDEYLENCLKDIPNAKSLKMQQKNMIRQCIRAMFPTRKCFIFGSPPPSNQTTELRPPRDLNEQFTRKTEEFCQYIYDNVEAKTLQGGQTVTGSILWKLLPKYIKAVKSGDFTALETSISYLAAEKNEKCIKSATNLYEEKMKSKSVHMESEFQELHDICMKEALQTFQRTYFKHKKEENRKYEDALKAILMEKKNSFWKLCEESSLKVCSDLIQQLAKPLEKALHENKYHVVGGHGAFTEEKNKFVSRYNQECGKHVKAEDVLQAYLKTMDNVEKIIHQTDTKLSETKKRKYKVDDVGDSGQLTDYIRSYQLESKTHQRLLIQVIGFTGHGKSSFVNSCLYTVHSKSFENHAAECSTTLNRRGYQLTESITIADNRGFHPMDSSVMNEIYAQLGGFVPLNQPVIWGENKHLPLTWANSSVPDLVVPVLICRATYCFNNKEFQEMKQFLKDSQKITKILPFVVITNKLSGSSDYLEGQFFQMGIEKIYALENYTVQDHDRVRQKHLVFLKFLYDVLQTVDFIFK
ncbi:guanylate-binding protein 3-like [Spea bombifrons]|uniref:guanylate-binding protein 3-like n=1 Tax=Spea bombifrons TaxID=233779 RepID=UPI00234AC4F1|nr:guanylate-binding protein 3-like [Spea bombifrons]